MDISLQALQDSVSKLHETFAAFQSAQEDRFKALLKGKDDPVEEAKLDAINAELGTQQAKVDELQAQIKEYQEKQAALERDLESMSVPGIGNSPYAQVRLEHKAEFEKYMRWGEASGRSNLAQAAQKLDFQYAVDSSDGPELGWTAPKDIDKRIREIKKTRGAMRQIADSHRTSRAVYQMTFDVGEATSGWVGEKDSRPETEVGELATLEVPVDEQYAMPSAFQNILDDSEVNVEQWITRQVGRRLTQQEDKAFIDGDGVKKPRGVLTYPMVDLSPSSTAKWEWGKVSFVKSQDASSFPKVTASDTEAPARGLIDLIHSMHPADRAGAVFLMNDLTLARIRKMTDGNGNFIWQPSMTASHPQNIFGYRVVIDDYMPDIGANAFPILYLGQEGYVVVDRQGTRMLRDPYTTKGKVKFYTTQRVGGGVGHYQQIRLLKIAA